MKQTYVYILLLLASVVCSCNKNVYSELLKEEEKLIESFIDQMEIEIVIVWNLPIDFLSPFSHSRRHFIYDLNPLSRDERFYQFFFFF